MRDLYRLDPEALRAKTRQAREEHLITLRDDSTKPPPTLGTAPWQGILFGPALGQPGSGRSASPASAFVFKVMLGLATLAVVGFFVRALMRGF